MKDIFLFSSLIDPSHTFSYFFHLAIVIVLALIVAKLATSSMQLVPRGMQNLAEAFLDGILSMGKDTMGSEAAARKYLPLVATIGFIVFFSNICYYKPFTFIKINCIFVFLIYFKRK